MAKSADAVQPAKPEYVGALEAVFGAPSQAGFGSAIFFERMQPTDALEPTALRYYQFFVGEAWAKFGADAWMATWRQVYARPAGAKPDILNELHAIPDRAAKLSASVMLEGISEPARAEQALVAAFDDATVSKLEIYNLGDGGALSGILIASQRGANQEATFLTFLLD